MGVIAHAAALRDGGEWLDAVLAGSTATGAPAAARLARHLPDAGYRPPEGT